MRMVAFHQQSPFPHLHRLYCAVDAFGERMLHTEMTAIIRLCGKIHGSSHTPVIRLLLLLLLLPLVLVSVIDSYFHQPQKHNSHRSPPLPCRKLQQTRFTMRRAAWIADNLQSLKFTIFAHSLSLQFTVLHHLALHPPDITAVLGAQSHNMAPHSTCGETIHTFSRTSDTVKPNAVLGCVSYALI